MVVAVILAILCAYSLWKKRRTLCGWGFNEHIAQSEGDSAGSCYAPPQYSRCNSFHHPPPPYTEVTSKPDLYPLVFTCNSDNNKHGSSYLMVQYFRNYIVRPAAGSLSAASTVDSLSSSFICNINEANTLVPPPYSRAASPEIGFSSHFQHNYLMPRSASQIACQSVNNTVSGVIHPMSNSGPQSELNSKNMDNQQGFVGQNSTQYAKLTVNSAENQSDRFLGSGNGDDCDRERVGNYNANLRDSESGRPSMREPEERTSDLGNNTNVINNSSDKERLPRKEGFAQSQSDQHFGALSNCSISDIFVNNSCTAEIGNTNGGSDKYHASVNSELGLPGTVRATIQPKLKGIPVIYTNGCIKFNPLHRVNTNPNQINMDAISNHVYQSSNSLGGISVTVPANVSDDIAMQNNGCQYQDLQFLRQSLETCSQLLLQQHQQQKLSQNDYNINDGSFRINDPSKKYIDDGLLRSYVTSGSCSGVSSLANIGTPSSPPQATSPTGEVKEILDQIRQLQEGVNKYEEDVAFRISRPVLQHTLSTPAARVTLITSPTKPISESLPRISTMPDSQTVFEANSDTDTSPSSLNLNSNITRAAGGSFFFASSSKRPSTLQQSTKKRFSTPKSSNKCMYIPMVTTTQMQTASRCTILKSPVTSVVNSNLFLNRSGRVRRGWISRSAPTTPATPLPPSYMGDESPLLNNHDEDQEGEQTAELEN